MDYFNLLDVLPNASKEELLRSFNKKLSFLVPRSKTSLQEYEQLVAVKKAFCILYERNTSVENNQISYDPLAVMVEIYKIPWNHLSSYPSKVIILKIVVELVGRLFLAFVGGAIGVLSLIYFYFNNHRTVSYPGIFGNIVPGELEAAIIVFALILFFGKEILALSRRARKD